MLAITLWEVLMLQSTILMAGEPPDWARMLARLDRAWSAGAITRQDYTETRSLILKVMSTPIKGKANAIIS
jgi:hypothetical protein